jgi:hypothetical protein
MLKVGRTWFSWFSAAAKGAGVEFVVAVIKQAPIEGISPWVSQNVLRRGDQNSKGAFADWFQSCFGICSRIVGTYWVILALELPECLPKFWVN